MKKINYIHSNEDNRKIIKCPWCHKHSMAPKITSTMILVLSCMKCAKPIIFFNNTPYKIEQEIMELDDPRDIEDFIYSFLEEHGIDLLNLHGHEDFDNDPITKTDICEMKKFLKKFKIPLDGDVF